MKNVGQALGLDKLLIDEIIHFSIALIIGSVLAIIFSSLWLIFFSLLVGFFIDADHLVDYFACFWQNRQEVDKKSWFNPVFHLKNFFNPFSYVKRSNRVIVPFHGWELAPLFWLLFRWLGDKIGLAGLEWTSLAYLAHLSWDQLVCAGNWRSYFLIHRLLNRFSYQAYC
ncbi:MAG: hypothetical protein PHR64_02775 [Candidatus Shapirobacteria bacterium]|nr:hypothetical protein [Candidatus Shapirobacteria bacterium]MDD5074136.1 hypothetical protein [Candidatus Shapirobacteria bacterium]MDD5481846.1 hypothetical protein [Candidatus Shapirobacteria bacterium]